VNTDSIDEGGKRIVVELASEAYEPKFDVAKERWDVWGVEEMLPTVFYPDPAADPCGRRRFPEATISPNPKCAITVKVVCLLRLNLYSTRPEYDCSPPKKPSTACPLTLLVKSYIPLTPKAGAAYCAPIPYGRSFRWGISRSCAPAIWPVKNVNNTIREIMAGKGRILMG
jgi:hypothetical protein